MCVRVYTYARAFNSSISAQLEPHRVHSNPMLSGEPGPNTARKDKALPGKFASGKFTSGQRTSLVVKKIRLSHGVGKTKPQDPLPLRMRIEGYP